MKLLVMTGIFALVINLTVGMTREEQSKESRIVGGERIRIEEAPYQVSLRYFNYHICGGAIISKDYVITAAHCTFGRKLNHFSVRVGTAKMLEDGAVHNVSAIKNHHYYNAKTFEFDVALLLLATEIKINNYTTQEISLPLHSEQLPEKTPVLVSGWGQTRNVNESNLELRAVVLAVSNQKQCHLKYTGTGVTLRSFCAFALDKDACLGDSGGPVRRLSDGKLVGLVSFGHGNKCASPDYPGVYTRIASVRTWIWINAKV